MIIALFLNWVMDGCNFDRNHGFHYDFSPLGTNGTGYFHKMTEFGERIEYLGDAGKEERFALPDGYSLKDDCFGSQQVFDDNDQLCEIRTCKRASRYYPVVVDCEGNLISLKRA